MIDQLLLLRHAKSDWDTNSDDFDRPLNARGSKDAPRIGQWLREHDLIPDGILCSPARRARQTALAVCAEMHYPAERISWTDRLYLASREDLLDMLSGSTWNLRKLLVIGHNPGLEQLLEYLALQPPPRQANGKLFTTACLAQLQLATPPAQFAPHSAQLQTLVRARDL